MRLETSLPGAGARTFLLAAFALMCGAQWCFTAGNTGVGVAALFLGWACLAPLGRPAGPPEGGRRGIVPAAAGVFLVALALRLWRLDEIPPVWWDEGVEGYDARCVAAGLPLEELEGIYYHRGPLWLLLLAASGSFFGFSIGALRAVAAVAGATVAVLSFLLGTRLFGLAGGLVAGAWMATHPWPLNMSRIMIGNILVPLAGAGVVLLCLQRRWRPSGRGVASGLVSGASMYGYAAAAQLPLLGPAVIWLSGGTSPRERARAMVISIVVAAAVVLPYRIVYPDLWGKARNVSVLDRPLVMIGNLVDTIGMFNVRGDPDMRHQYPPAAPVLDGVVGPLFMLGAGIVLRYARQASSAMILVWMGLGLLPGIASEGGERNLFRMVGALPAVSLLVGAGGAAVAAQMGRRSGVLVLAGLVAVSALAGGRRYLVLFPADPATAAWYRTYNREAAADLKDLAARSPLSLCSPLTLARHPLEKFFLFDEIRSGRVATAGGGCRITGRPERVYRDPWGQPAALLRTARGSGGVEAEYRTILDLGTEGDGLVREGRAREAVDLYRRYLALVPESVLLWERLGFAALKAGREEDALRAFERAIDLGSNMPATYNGLASVLFSLGRYAAAEEAMVRAIELAPGEPGFQHDLDRIRRAGGRHTPGGEP